MSERIAETRSTRSRTRPLGIALLIVVGAFVGVAVFADQWTQWLWFRSLGFGRVYSTQFGVRAGLFGVFGGGFAALVWASAAAAYAARPALRAGVPHAVVLAHYREAVAPLRRILLVGPALVLGLLGGLAGASRWNEYLMWAHGVPFGKRDPFFHRDAGFYVFDLPWWHFVVGFAITALVFALLLNVFVHYLYGGIRLSPYHRSLSRAATAQVSVLLCLLALAKGVDYWLSRYDLVVDRGGVVDGMTYAGDHAALASRTVLAGVAVVCAVLFAVAAQRGQWLMPIVGVGLFGIAAVVLGAIWPAIVQTARVDGHTARLEKPYVAANIAATRAAYGIASVSVGPTGATPPTSVPAAASTLSVMDPRAIGITVRQVQQERPFYSLPDALSVSDYLVGGQLRPILIAARGIDPGGIPEAARTWDALHTAYTHGSGVVAAYGDVRTPAGLPVWASGDLPALLHSQVYFAPDATTYAVVGGRGGEVEPTGTSTYAGADGIGVGSWWRRSLLALRAGDTGFLSSNQITSQSRVLLNRTPAERVDAVAPWLKLGTSATPTIADGHLLWVLDGYTTSDSYPQSQHESFSDMTSDSTAPRSAFGALPTDSVNYVRQSVIATVDAYDGTVRLYAWDEGDPILRAMSAAFPGTVSPKSAIPADLLPHLGYGDELLRIQRNMLGDYHVTDPSAFLAGTQRWTPAPDPGPGSRVLPPTSQVVNGVPQLTTAFVNSSGALAAYLTVADGTTGAGLHLATLPSSPAVAGPTATATAFNADPRVGSLRSADPTTTLGQMVVMPFAGGALTYEPIYVTNSSGARVLNSVVAWFGGRVGMGATLAEALSDAVASNGTASPASVTALLQQAKAAFKDADAARAKGDQSGYDLAVAHAQALVAEAASVSPQAD